jgi:transglutaminase-like putative cysteine protease
MNHRQFLILSLVTCISMPLPALAAAPFPLSQCHLESKPAVTVHATMGFDLRVAPEFEATEWVIYAPILPSLSRQIGARSSFSTKDKSISAQTLRERSPLQRPVQVIHVKNAVNYTRELPVQAEYWTQLHSCKLTPGKAAKPVADLTPAEENRNLLETFSLDYKKAPVQSWLTKNNLRKTAAESDIEFAWRVFETIKQNYKYNWSPTLDRRVSKTVAIDATDCGGLSYLFCAALRANGIPARVLIGRNAKSTEGVEDGSGYFNCHVKSEFFAKNIGWIPVDMSRSVSHPDADPMRYFGTDPGNFITLHENPDLILDSFHSGLKRIRSMQDFRYWIKGNGLYKTPQRRIEWKVEKL